jgi:hypothetical protein
VLLATAVLAGGACAGVAAAAEPARAPQRPGLTQLLDTTREGALVRAVATVRHGASAAAVAPLQDLGLRVQACRTCPCCS